MPLVPPTEDTERPHQQIAAVTGLCRRACHPTNGPVTTGLKISRDGGGGPQCRGDWATAKAACGIEQISLGSPGDPAIEEGLRLPPTHFPSHLPSAAGRVARDHRLFAEALLGPSGRLKSEYDATCPEARHAADRLSEGRSGPGVALTAEAAGCRDSRFTANGDHDARKVVR